MRQLWHTRDTADQPISRFTRGTVFKWQRGSRIFLSTIWVWDFHHPFVPLWELVATPRFTGQDLLDTCHGGGRCQWNSHTCLFFWWFGVEITQGSDCHNFPCFCGWVQLIDLDTSSRRQKVVPMPLNQKRHSNRVKIFSMFRTHSWTRWWQLKYFWKISPRKLGFHDPIWLAHIFQMGWFNHHQVEYFFP